MILLGFGPFAAGGMLLWGLIALLPILLHLLRRRRSRTVRWGAMQFLQAAIARRAKQFQFWRLLLLCLRVAAVLVIAAALARPLLKDDAASGADERQRPARLRVLVIDTSFSMGALRQTSGREGGENRSSFQSAQEAAIEIGRSAARGDGFLLLTMSDPPQTIIPSVTPRADQTIAEIARLSPTEGGADLPATLSSIEAAIADAVRRGWRGPIDVILFSDLQQSTWQSLPASPPRPAAGGEPPPASIRYLVWDAAAPLAGDNATVGAVERDSSGASSDDSIAWLTPIAHSGGDAIRGRLAQLWVDGHVVQSQSFDLEPGDSRTLLWSTRLSPGRHGVEVRIGDDALAADNVSRTVAEIAPGISVAAFGPNSTDTRYLALAAAPAGSGAIQVRSFPLRQLPQIEIGRFDVWVLCDPTPLRDAAAERIRQHVGQGGGVVWWLGPNWQSGQGGTADALTVGSWTARKITHVDSPNVDPLGYEAGFVRPFEAFPGAGLLSLPVFRYWTVELGKGWQPAVAIGDGDPLVASFAAEGGGRQVLVATPPGPGSADASSGNASSGEPWNALIAWPSFVPLVQEILRWAEAGEQGTASLVVGQPIAGQSREDEMGEQLKNVSSTQGSSTQGSGAQEAAAVLDVEVRSRSGNTVRWTAEAPRRAGFYQWIERERGRAERGGAAATPSEEGLPSKGSPTNAPVIAVNVDPAEGRLQKIAELPDAWKRVDEAAPQRSTDLLSEASAAGESGGWGGGGERELFWWFLFAALGLLAAEALVVKFLEGRF